GEHCTRSVVGVGYRAREVAPAEAARSSTGERVRLGVLAGEEPVEALGAEEFGDVFACSGEGIDRKCRVPGGEVGVDGPGSVGAGGVDEEFEAGADNFVRRASG